jgi:hypothetical protein
LPLFFLVEIDAGFFGRAGKDHVVHQHLAVLLAGVDSDFSINRSAPVASFTTGSMTVMVNSLPLIFSPFSIRRMRDPGSISPTISSSWVAGYSMQRRVGHIPPESPAGTG